MSGVPDVNMMMQQIEHLQNHVRQLQTSAGQGWGGHGAGGGSHRDGGNITSSRGNDGTWSNRETDDTKEVNGEGNLEKQKVLLVSNIPSNLANPDSLFYAFEKFGAVERVKILRNKRNTALIQMSHPGEARTAVEEQDKLNRVGTEIYVNYSSRITEVLVPVPGRRDYDDGLAKDYTGQRYNNPSLGGKAGGMMNNIGADGMMNNMGAGGFMNIMKGGGMMNSMGAGGMMNNMGGRMMNDIYGMHSMGGRYGQQPGGVVLLVSNIPDQIAKVENIFNMIGMYGDVIAVKILRNKRDCCLVQLAKPHHAQQVRNYLDQAKVGGNKLCISNSRVETLLNKRIPEDNELQADFSNSRNHRYRNHAMAAKLTKNLGPPSSTLHVANLPEGLNHNDIKDMFIEKGFTAKESKECGASGNMALLTMASPDEALLALAVMHNYAPEEYKFKNTAGLCVSFSAKK